MLDYGTIVIYLKQNMTPYEKKVIVKQSIENQLLTNIFKDYNEIMYISKEISEFVDEEPMSITFKLKKYSFNLKFEIFE